MLYTNGKECAIKKISFDFVKQEFNERNYILLSTEYINIEQIMKFICNKHSEHGVQEIKYHYFHNKNRGCIYCSKENRKSKRIPDSELISLCESKNLTFVSSEAINGKTSVSYICNNHIDKGVQKTNIASIRKMKKGCVYCIGWHKTTEDFKKELHLISPDIIVLGEYKSAKTKILCECKKDNTRWSAVPNALLRGQGCPECGRKNSNKNSTKSHNKFVAEMLECQPDIKILGKYQGVFKKILVNCLVCGDSWETTPNSLKMKPRTPATLVVG